jgi:hypothetical protein
MKEFSAFLGENNWMAGKKVILLPLAVIHQMH